MPLMNTPFEPGYCVQTIENMRPGPKKDIALAEYHYFSGQAEKAMRETEGYLTAQDSAVRLSACWIFAYSCLTMGRIDHARRALQQIKNTLADGGKTSPAVRAMEAFVAFAAAVLAARNWTNQEIAQYLNLSVNTVKHHLSKAMKKLNVSHRKDLKQYMLQ